jgi:ubiquinone/menaquinone biosynthesis C-methylase UbiE
MKARSKYFDTIAEDFDSWMNKFDLITREAWFASHLDNLDLKGHVVLDVGCGLGHFSNQVLECGGVPVPLDVGRRLLTKVKEHMINCVQGDALNLPFPSASFSCVISSECIEHTSAPIQAIKEMSRVTKSGGILILSTPNRLWRWSLAVAGFFRVRKFHGTENWLSRKSVREALVESDMSILVDQGLYILPFQIKPALPIIKWFNRKGQFLKTFMIGQCWVARKN